MFSEKQKKNGDSSMTRAKRKLVILANGNFLKSISWNSAYHVDLSGEPGESIKMNNHYFSLGC
jgi:hypothetical protein